MPTDMENILLRYSDVFGIIFESATPQIIVL